jgi:hypothetical protein
MDWIVAWMIETINTSQIILAKFLESDHQESTVGYAEITIMVLKK